jgi:hypothetical protein
MSYRDDLAAAHARIEALEVELALVCAERDQLRAQLEELSADAELGRETRASRDAKARKLDERQRKAREKEDARVLKEKMQREQREVEKALREQTERDEARRKQRQRDLVLRDT